VGKSGLDAASLGQGQGLASQQRLFSMELEPIYV